jgi:ABC-2 type transport system permease protein
MWRAYTGLIKKELLQVFRDSNMVRLIFAIPIIQLLILGYVVNVDVKDLSLDVYDFDRSNASVEFVDAMKAGDYFVPTTDHPNLTGLPLWLLDERFKSSTSELALILPDGFSKELTNGGNADIGLVVDGSNASSARTGMGYAAQIVRQFSQKETGLKPTIGLREQFLYNPEMKSVYFMVPGIIAPLLTMITIMLTSMAIVREREVGTLEQLMVTPISANTLLFGKITTFAGLGLLEMMIAIAFGTLWFGIPFVGSAPLLFALSLLYLFTTLGIGMFFSTVTSTQQQAMFFAWFFSVFAILTSGFFTPVSNMPQWMQYVTLVNPMRFFVVIVRGIMLKGAGVMDLLPQIVALVIFGSVIFTFSALRFKKRAA